MEKQYLSDSDVGFGANQASGGQSKAAPKYLSDSDVGFGPASTDGTNGGPRKAGETRPASVSLNFGIYFE